MGNKSSSENVVANPVDGNATVARAVARGRVYVIVRYPQVVEKLETHFTDDNLRKILAHLQQVSINHMNYSH